MNEDVASPYFAEQKPLDCLIQKGNEIPREMLTMPEPEAKDEMFNKGIQAARQPEEQPTAKSADQSAQRPVTQPDFQPID